MLVLCAGYWFGRPEPRKWACRLAIALPLLTLIACGVEPAFRAATRIDDGIRTARHLNENGVDLVWAPEGRGWPTHGMSWQEAVQQCRHLTKDGKSLAGSPQDIWRLPTADEAVRSQSLHGENSGGTWDATTDKATYQRRPDKETPLWNPRSKVIYWWTATEADEDRAHAISYLGKVRPRRKEDGYGYLAFRAVKSPDASSD